MGSANASRRSSSRSCVRSARFVSSAIRVGIPDADWADLGAAAELTPSAARDARSRQRTSGPLDLAGQQSDDRPPAKAALGTGPPRGSPQFPSATKAAVMGDARAWDGGCRTNQSENRAVNWSRANSGRMGRIVDFSGTRRSTRASFGPYCPTGACAVDFHAFARQPRRAAVVQLTPSKRMLPLALRKSGGGPALGRAG